MNGRWWWKLCGRAVTPALLLLHGLLRHRRRIKSIIRRRRTHVHRGRREINGAWAVVDGKEEPVLLLRRVAFLRLAREDVHHGRRRDGPRHELQSRGSTTDGNQLRRRSRGDRERHSPRGVGGELRVETVRHRGARIFERRLRCAVVTSTEDKNDRVADLGICTRRVERERSRACWILANIDHDLLATGRWLSGRRSGSGYCCAGAARCKRERLRLERVRSVTRRGSVD